jgi:quinol monooxygenase YgiN/predicted ATPase
MCKSIVLTGGPGSGKTRLATLLAERHPGWAAVPEAATQVYDQLATRWDLLDLPGRRDVQQRIYHLQLQQEQALRRLHTGRVLILDRGTVDGSAYWPEGPADYWRRLGTTAQRELARYDAAIWLQSAAAIGLYDADASNPCRHEDAPQAIECGRRLEAVWMEHPRLFRVEARARFEDKLSAVERIISTISRGEAMYTVIVTAIVRPESVGAFIDATLDNARNARLEPGNLRFDVLRAEDDPNKFVLYEAYRSREDFAAHQQTEHYLRWKAIVADFMAQPRSSVKATAL